MKQSIWIYLIMVSILIACKSTKQVSSLKNQPQTGYINENQQTIIYKTIKDYSDFVPVIMNADKTEIISYPAPADLFYDGKLAKPTALKNGYLLDNRGITENIAFLSYTYETYSKLKQAPPSEELLLKIIDKNPLLEMYYCGSRIQYSDEIQKFNNLIDNNFSECKKANIIPLQIMSE